MDERLYQMTFGQWCNETKGTTLTLTEYGEIDWRDKAKKYVMERYHDLWMAERKEFVLRDKNEKINNALMNLKKAGFECVLSNYQNGHIKAKNRHGVIMSYYATTGTIAGYLGTNVQGIDEFIRILRV